MSQQDKKKKEEKTFPIGVALTEAKKSGDIIRIRPLTELELKLLT